MMKKYIKHTLFAGALAMLVFACDRAGQYEDFNQGTEPAAVATWVTSPAGNLTLSDPTSAVAFEVEFIGTTVDQFEMSVAIDNDRLTASGVLLTASVSGNYSGSFTLADIASALAVSVTDFVEGDEFTFSSTVTSNGITYPSSNGNTREFDAVVDFDEAILVETVKLDDNSIASDGIISAGQTDSVFLEFTSDLGVRLETLPTITRTSVSGNIDDAIGPVRPLVDEDGEVVRYYFLYTAGVAATDVISFQVSDASAVSVDGFAMEQADLPEVFTIDNVDPTVLQDASLGNRFLMVFSEQIASVTAVVDYLATDDNDGPVDVSIDEDGITLDYSFDWSAGDPDVNLTLAVADQAGNTLTIGTFTFRN